MYNLWCIGFFGFSNTLPFTDCCQLPLMSIQ
jgi:hypothetical protein